MKRSMVPVVSVLAAMVASLVVTAPQALADGRHRPPPGPRDLTGVLHGAQYEIRVPARWNGTLVMHAHGYRDAADHPGEVDDRSAQAFVDDTVEQAMLAAGYAVAGSGYASNGWAVDDGLRDTKALVEHFTRVVGRPHTTLLAGFSMGSVIAFESMERYRGTYDGALPSCAVGAGAPRAFDGTLAVLSAYAAVYGWPAAWGRSPADVRDDLDFDTEVLPVIAGRLGAPGGAASFEFMRLVAGVPRGPEWPFNIWFFSTEGRAELERRAGGPVAQNRTHRYVVSAADRAYLAGIGVPGEQVDDYLATMMDDREGAQRTRRYVERYAEYTGRISEPVLTLGTTVDSLVPPAHIAAYRATVADAGRTRDLASVWTTGVGHCNFTAPQLVTAVQALERWVHTGRRPGTLPADLGFVSYTPPAWPQR